MKFFHHSDVFCSPPPFVPLDSKFFKKLILAIEKKRITASHISLVDVHIFFCERWYITKFPQYFLAIKSNLLRLTFHFLIGERWFHEFSINFKSVCRSNYVGTKLVLKEIFFKNNIAVSLCYGVGPLWANRGPVFWASETPLTPRR